MFKKKVVLELEEGWFLVTVAPHVGLHCKLYSEGVLGISGGVSHSGQNLEMMMRTPTNG